MKHSISVTLLVIITFLAPPLHQCNAQTNTWFVGLEYAAVRELIEGIIEKNKWSSTTCYIKSENVSTEYYRLDYPDNCNDLISVFCIMTDKNTDLSNDELNTSITNRTDNTFIFVTGQAEKYWLFLVYYQSNQKLIPYVIELSEKEVSSISLIQRPRTIFEN